MDMNFYAKQIWNTPPEKSDGVLMLYSRYCVFTLRSPLTAQSLSLRFE
jgi:hypothetical protein